MAKKYRIIDFRGHGGGFEPEKFVTKEELFDASTGKIKPKYIDASISAEIDLVKTCTNAEDTPKNVTWKKSSTVTVAGLLEASYSTRSFIYIMKDYDKEYYDAYMTIEVGGNYKWERIVGGGGNDLDYDIIGK